MFFRTPNGRPVSHPPPSTIHPLYKKLAQHAWNPGGKAGILTLGRLKHSACKTSHSTRKARVRTRYLKRKKYQELSEKSAFKKSREKKVVRRFLTYLNFFIALRQPLGGREACFRYIIEVFCLCVCVCVCVHKWNSIYLGIPFNFICDQICDHKWII